MVFSQACISGNFYQRLANCFARNLKAWPENDRLGVIEVVEIGECGTKYFFIEFITKHFFRSWNNFGKRMIFGHNEIQTDVGCHQHTTQGVGVLVLAAVRYCPP